MNGQAAVGAYSWDEARGAYLPFALDVLTFEGDRIKQVTAFITRSAEGTEKDFYTNWPTQPLDRARFVFERFRPARAARLSAPAKSRVCAKCDAPESGARVSDGKRGYRVGDRRSTESEASMAEHHGNDLRERPTSELLKQLSDQTTTLVRQEIELAKLEVREKGKKAGMGAGMFGGAGRARAVRGRRADRDDHPRARDVPARLGRGADRDRVYAAIAGILALRGQSEVKEATPPMPEQAVETTKEDVRWVKTRAQSARRHKP